MATAITYYLVNTVAGTSSHMMVVSGTAPNSAQTGTGWIFPKDVTSKAAILGALVKTPATSFGVTVVPTTGSLSTRDAMRTQAALTGTFDSGNWLITIGYGTDVSNGAFLGRPQMRVYRSVNEDGSASTELTTSILTGTQGGIASTTTGFLSTTSFNPGATTLANEYLFFQLAWAVNTAATNAGNDLLLTTGTSCSIITAPFGTSIVTSALLTEAFWINQTDEVAAAKTFYFVDSLAGVSSHMALQDGGTAPASKVPTSDVGWFIASVVASQYSLMQAKVVAATTTFSGTPLVPGSSSLGTKEAWRTANPLWGTFTGSAWYVSMLVFNINSNATGRGYPRWRLWVGSAQDGSNATEITTDVQCGTGVNLNFSTVGTGIISTVSFIPGTLTVTSQYLFFAVAWAVSSLDSVVGAELGFTLGNSASITTAPFRPNLITPSWTTVNRAFSDSQFLADAYSRVFLPQRAVGEAGLFADLLVGSFQAAGITKTLYFLDAIAGTGSHMALQDGGTAPGSAQTATGWTVSLVAASNYALMGAQQLAPTTSFAATLVPGSASLGTREAFRTQNTLYGRFGNNPWTVALLLGDVNLDVITRGYPRWRLWVGSAQDGSNATEITTDVQCGQVIAGAIASGTISSVAFSPGAFTATSQYLFLALGWSVASAGLLTTDYRVSVGNSSSVVTAPFGSFVDRRLTESPWMADAWGRQVGSTRTVSDMLMFAEATGQATTRLRSFLDSVLTADRLDQWATRLRTLAEAVLTADKIDEQTIAARALTEAVLTADSTLVRIPLSIRLQAETMLTADRLDQQAIMPRRLAEAVLAADRMDTLAVRPRVLVEAVLMADALSSLSTLQRSVAESALLSEATARTILAMRSILEAAGLADLVQSAATMRRTLTEVVAFSDRMIAVITANLYQILDTLAVADAERHVVLFQRLLSEAMPTSDLIQAAVGLARQLFEALDLADVIGLAARFQRAVTEAFVEADQVSSMASRPRQLLEALSLPDVQAGFVRFQRSAGETLSMSEQDIRTLILARQVAETVLTTDRTDRLLSAARTLAESVLVADRLDSGAVKPRLLAETVLMADQGARQVMAARSLAEALLAIDSTAVQIPRPVRILAETFLAADRVDRAALVVRQTLETVLAADRTDRQALLARALAETVLASDRTDRQALPLRTLAEAVLAAEQTGRQVMAARTLAEAVLTADRTDRQALPLRTLAEVVLATDRTDRQALTARALAEALLAADLTAQQVFPLRTLAEAVLTADRTDRQVKAARTLAEAVLSADAVAVRIPLSIRILAEAVLASDSVAEIKEQFVRLMLDLLAFMDRLDEATLVQRDRPVSAAGMADTFLVQVFRPKFGPPIIGVVDFFSPQAAIRLSRFWESTAIIDPFAPVTGVSRT